MASEKFYIKEPLSNIVRCQPLNYTRVMDFPNVCQAYILKSGAEIPWVIPQLSEINYLDEHYYGIETEVEGIHSDYSWKAVDSLAIQKEEPSLRSGGREFVSPPLHISQISMYLQALFSYPLAHQGSFSKRCSTHVHMNVQHLTPEKIANILITYVVLEKLLFVYVGEQRDQNNFCVPIYQTATLSGCIESLQHNMLPVIFAEKYVALNLNNIWSTGNTVLGTLEFRHLPGTRNTLWIETWINILHAIKLFGVRMEYDQLLERIFVLNTDSRYHDFVNEVLGPQLSEHLTGLLGFSMLTKLMTPTVCEVKRACGANPAVMLKFLKHKVRENSPFAKAMATMYKLPKLDKFDEIPEQRPHTHTPIRQTRHHLARDSELDELDVRAWQERNPLEIQAEVDRVHRAIAESARVREL